MATADQTPTNALELNADQVLVKIISLPYCLFSLSERIFINFEIKGYFRNKLFINLVN